MGGKIEMLHPTIRDKAQQLIDLCKKQNIHIRLSQTLRTKEEQDSLYAQGRTKPGMIVTKVRYPQSLHCWGVAFDIVVLTSWGKVTWDIEAYKEVAPIGKGLGLEWGGDWTDFRDYPHYQLPGYSWKALQKKFGNPNRFIASWSKEVNRIKDDDRNEVDIIIGDKAIGGIIINFRSYGPVRDIAEALGKQVEWDPGRKVVLIPPVTVTVPAAAPGEVLIAVGDQLLPGRIINGRAYAIVVDLARALGYKTKWDGIIKTVEVR